MTYPLPADAAEYRASGTDLSERRRSGVSTGPLVDIAPTAEMLTIGWSEAGAASIGASVTIAQVAADARITSAYPGIAAAAFGLATPQIRHVATLGGNLAQRSRCWYFRNPHIACLKKGGSDCPAREGNHLYSVAFDLGPCVAPHPSTMAAALLAYEAAVATSLRQNLDMIQVLGDGSSASDHQLANGELITAIQLPAPLRGERASYKRAISRTHAEWPLVELVVRIVVVDQQVQFVRIVAGGIAPVPIRLPAVEAALAGQALSPASISAAAKAAVSGAKPLRLTGYKLHLLAGLVEDMLSAHAA